MITKIMDARLSFPSLFEPTAFKDGAPSFNATFLVPKGSAMAKQIESDYRATAKEKWGAKADAVVSSIQGNSNRFCVQDGDAVGRDGYKGMLVVKAKSQARPRVVDRNGSPLVAADGRPYAGCYVNASIEFFGYDNPGKGISAQLRAVAFNRDGDSFAGGTPMTDSEVADLAVGSDGDDVSDLL